MAFLIFHAMLLLVVSLLSTANCSGLERWESAHSNYETPAKNILPTHYAFGNQKSTSDVKYNGELKPTGSTKYNREPKYSFIYNGEHKSSFSSSKYNREQKYGNYEKNGARFGNIDRDDIVPYSLGNTNRHRSSDTNCSMIDGYCRVSTFRDPTNNKTHVELSCSCFPEESDVSASLQKLDSGPLCSLVPRTDHYPVVDYSILNITLCSLSKLMPVGLLRSLRRSRHVTVWLQDSSAVRLPLHDTDLLQPYLEDIDVTIINSKLSGIGRGLVSGTKRLRFSATNSEIGVVGSHAFAHYHSPHAHVMVNITNSNVTKFAKDAIKLPTSGHFILNNVRINTLDGGAVSGAGEVLFQDCKIGLISKGALNIADLYKLQLNRCTVAELEARALISKRNRDNRSNVNDTNGGVIRRCHVIINSTVFVSSARSSLTEVCRAAQLTWRNNALIDVVGGEPLMLQSPTCPLPPASILSATLLKCGDCSIFQQFTPEMCPVYSLMSWCSECSEEKPCEPQSLESFVVNHCPHGATIAHTINATCRPDRQLWKLKLEATTSSSVVLQDHLYIGYVFLLVIVSTCVPY